MAPEPEAPSDDYDDLTVEEAKAAVRGGEIDASATLDYEREHKDRVTLTNWLEGRVVEADEDGTEPETVPVASRRPGMIAGMFFASGNETRVVEKTPRVEEAIATGDLRLLDREP